MSSLITCPVCNGDGYLEVGDIDGVASAITCPLAAVVGPLTGIEGGCREGTLALPLAPAVVEALIERDEGELDDLYNPPPDCAECSDTGWEGESGIPPGINFQDYEPPRRHGRRAPPCPYGCEAGAYRMHQRDQQAEMAWERHIDDRIDQMRGK